MDSCRKSSLSAMLVIGVACISSARLAGTEISWGTPAAGLRVGVAIEPGSAQSGKLLRVVFQNLTKLPQSLLIGVGGMSPPVVAYQFEIWAVRGGEEKYLVGYVIDGGLGQLIPIGLPAAYVSSLPPGRLYEVILPFLYTFVPEADGDTGLEELLRKNFKVRVTYSVLLRTKGDRYLANTNPNFWTGEIISGDVGLAPIGSEPEIIADSTVAVVHFSGHQTIMSKTKRSIYTEVAMNVEQVLRDPSGTLRRPSRWNHSAAEWTDCAAQSQRVARFGSSARPSLFSFSVLQAGGQFFPI